MESKVVVVVARAVVVVVAGAAVVAVVAGGGGAVVVVVASVVEVVEVVEVVDVGSSVVFAEEQATSIATPIARARRLLMPVIRPEGPEWDVLIGSGRLLRRCSSPPLHTDGDEIPNEPTHCSPHAVPERVGRVEENGEEHRHDEEDHDHGDTSNDDVVGHNEVNL